MDKKNLFIIIAAFWLVIILGFFVIKEFTLQTGEEVLLKTRPIDPRDLFRGDYIILSYEISTLDSNSIDTDLTNFNINQKVYVRLSKEDGYGIPAGIYQNPPDGLFIKGIVKDNNNRLTIEYGIESYFVPEGEGREIERQRGKDLDVKVAIDRFGNAVIKALLIEGKEVNFG